MQTTQIAERDFGEMINARFAEGKFICLGLDPTYSKIPLCVPGRFEGEDVDPLEEALAFYNFCVQIVDATKDIVAAYKPNTAFFEACGAPGYEMLRLLIRHIHRVAPGVPVIVDAKRGDIGKTNLGTVRFIFDILQADAVTVNPLFGEEALRPFLDRPGKGVIVLCRTSNEGAVEFQNIMTQPSDEELEAIGFDPTWGRVPFYQYLAMRIRLWHSEGTKAVVVGATAPEELEQVRLILAQLTMLIPGIGIQGGDLVMAVTNGRTAEGKGFLLNAGSAALYASSEPDFAVHTRAAVIEMNNNAKAVLASAT